MHIERKKNFPCGSSFVHRTSTISLIPYFNKKIKLYKMFSSFLGIPKKRIREGIHIIIFEVKAKRGVDRQFFHVMSMHVFFSFKGSG